MSFADRVEDLTIPEPMSGCLLWLGRVSQAGYGYFSENGKDEPAHILNWRRKRGPVPLGLELDHKCRVRCCISEHHLEPVTHRVNVLRSTAPPAHLAQRTACNSGHQFTPQNTRHHRGNRACKACHRAREGARYRAKRAAALAARPLRVCPQCATEFVATRPDKIACSKRCSESRWKARAA